LYCCRLLLYCRVLYCIYCIAAFTPVSHQCIALTVKLDLSLCLALLLELRIKKVICTIGREISFSFTSVGGRYFWLVTFTFRKATTDCTLSEASQDPSVLVLILELLVALYRTTIQYCSVQYCSVQYSTVRAHPMRLFRPLLSLTALELSAVQY
jgi:hypothetical protein